jgi:hypothetical protein
MVSTLLNWRPSMPAIVVDQLRIRSPATTAVVVACDIARAAVGGGHDWRVARGGRAVYPESGRRRQWVDLFKEGGYERLVD